MKSHTIAAVPHPLANLPPARNMLEAAYRAVMLITQNGGRERYYAVQKLRATPPRQRLPYDGRGGFLQLQNSRSPNPKRMTRLFG